MSRLIVEQIVSTDGFAADRDGGIDFFLADDDFTHSQDEQLEMLAGVSAILFGATTYRMFADYWPTADPIAEPVAVPVNALPKHVFSSTLDSAPWGNGEPVTLEREEATVGVRRLKGVYDGNLIVWGSLVLTDSLFRAGLVDELRLRVLPVLLGAGRSIAPADLGQRALTLTSSRAYPDGLLSLSYSVKA